MTSNDVIYQRRVRVLTLAKELGNVAKACRLVGASRNSYYRWKKTAHAYGLEAVRPRARRRPRQPNEAPTWQVEIVLAEAVPVRRWAPASWCRFSRLRRAAVGQRRPEGLPSAGTSIAASGSVGAADRRHRLSGR